MWDNDGMPSSGLPPDLPRPFAELRDTGLLWLINRQVFHPRGYALALHWADGDVVGWSLLGDGTTPWNFEDGKEGAEFAAANATLPLAQMPTGDAFIGAYTDPDLISPEG